MNGVPTRKITLGAGMGALSAILVWALNTYAITPPDPKIPAEIAVAGATFLTFLVQYFVPDKVKT